MLTVGGLFSGIGGWELGLERAGMRVSWHCESDPYAQAVLERHWPGVPCYADVRALRGADVEPVDVLAGGFPCQDISVVGRGVGIDGDRSGLWSEYARLVGELRPRYVLVENVAALLGRGLGRVLGDLAALGYDAEWDCIPAAAIGAHHLRDRLWLVAYPSSPGRREDARGAHGDEGADEGRPPADDHQLERHGEGGRARVVEDAHDGHGEPGAIRGPGIRRQSLEEGADDDARGAGPGGRGRDAAHSYGIAPLGTPIAWRERGPWRTEPEVGRVADGVPRRMDRLRCLGNALVPQLAELIGRRIIEWEEGEVAA